jgi:hypothetical protein
MLGASSMSGVSQPQTQKGVHRCPCRAAALGPVASRNHAHHGSSKLLFGTIASDPAADPFQVGFWHILLSQDRARYSSPIFPPEIWIRGRAGLRCYRSKRVSHTSRAPKRGTGLARQLLGVAKYRYVRAMRPILLGMFVTAVTRAPGACRSRSIERRDHLVVLGSRCPRAQGSSAWSAQCR